MAEERNQFKIRNSWGVYDAYKSLRKNHWFNIGRALTEHEFYTIIRSVNKLLADNIVNGETVIFPANMGMLELRKHPKGVSFVNGKLKNTYPIDWGSTKKLWESDEEERQKATLIRYETPNVYHVKYCRGCATYENKSFYQFKLNAHIKKRLKEKIINGETDTLW